MRRVNKASKGPQDLKRAAGAVDFKALEMLMAGRRARRRSLLERQLSQRSNPVTFKIKSSTLIAQAHLLPQIDSARNQK